MTPNQSANQPANQPAKQVSSDGAGPGGIIVIILSLLVTFGVLFFIYPEHYGVNIGIHVLLAIYYFVAVGSPDLVLGAHLIYFIAIGLFILIISSNLKFSELFGGKLRYSFENNNIKVLNDMINRKLYKEDNGQIIDSKGFSLVKGIDRIDIIGNDQNEGLYGSIRLNQVENLAEAPIIRGKCISKNFVLSNNRHPRCKIDCSNNINCNNITWNTENKSCQLLSSCTKYNRDKRYKSLSLLKSASNILEEGQYLTRGNYIISQNGSHVLVIEESGILKFYDYPDGSNSEGLLIEDIEEMNINLTGHNLKLKPNGVLSYESKKGSIIWKTKNSPGLKTCLILLNRGLLVLYDITSDDIIWTSSSEWRDDYTPEDIRKELISEAELPIKLQYDLKKKKTYSNATLVQHRGTISIIDENGNEENGKIKVYTSKANSENYIHISETSVDGKYLIK